MASNTLGSSSIPPADPLLTSPTPLAQPKLAGKKRTAKSSSPRAVKRIKSSAPIFSPCHGSADINSQLIQAIHGLLETVKSLNSRLNNTESVSVKSAPDVLLAPPQLSPCDSDHVISLSAVSSTSSVTTAAALPTAQFPGSDAPITCQFNLLTVVLAQTFGRRFIPPAAVTAVTPLQILSNIIQSKDINLATLLLRTYVTDRKIVENSHSFSEFVIAFGIYRDVICQAFPDRRACRVMHLSLCCRS